MPGSPAPPGLPAGPGALDEPTSKSLLARFGIPVPRGRRIRTPEELPEALAALTQMQFEPASPLWLVIFGLGLFGFGWGLAGYCPGPAIVGAFVLDPRAWVFAAGLLVGMLVFERLPTPSKPQPGSA